MQGKLWEKTLPKIACCPHTYMTCKSLTYNKRYINKINHSKSPTYNIMRMMWIRAHSACRAAIAECPPHMHIYTFTIIINVAQTNGLAKCSLAVMNVIYSNYILYFCCSFFLCHVRETRTR